MDFGILICVQRIKYFLRSDSPLVVSSENIVIQIYYYLIGWSLMAIREIHKLSMNPLAFLYN